jgi:hypothetical protein
MGAPTGHLLDDLVGEVEDFERALIYLEPLMIEGHAAPSTSSRRSCARRIDTTIVA